MQKQKNTHPNRISRSKKRIQRRLEPSDGWRITERKPKNVLLLSGHFAFVGEHSAEQAFGWASIQFGFALVVCRWTCHLKRLSAGEHLWACCRCLCANGCLDISLICQKRLLREDGRWRQSDRIAKRIHFSRRQKSLLTHVDHTLRFSIWETSNRRRAGVRLWIARIRKPNIQIRIWKNHWRAALFSLLTFAILSTLSNDFNGFKFWTVF